MTESTILKADPLYISENDVIALQLVKFLLEGGKVAFEEEYRATNHVTYLCRLYAPMEHHGGIVVMSETYEGNTEHEMRYLDQWNPFEPYLQTTRDKMVQARYEECRRTSLDSDLVRRMLGWGYGR